MAFNVGEISASVTADQSKFDSAMGDVRRKGANAATMISKKFRQVSDSFVSAGRTLSTHLTLPIAALGGAAIKSAADFEALAVQMEVLTGSAEEGARAFEQLKQFSARTPFQLQDLVKAQNTLMGFGETTQDAFRHLKMLGDVAAVTGGDLQAITVAFGQAAAEGKLMTRDIRQLINQGVPAIKLLAESLGVAQSEILEMASAGEITFDVLVSSLEKATKAGGTFANGTERLAGTMKGLFSTLKDNVIIALSELGQVIAKELDLKRVTRNLSNFLQNITEAFRGMSSEAISRILKITGMLAVSGPLLVAIGKAGQIIVGFSKLVRSQFAIITAAFATGVGIGQWFVDNWNNFFGDAEADFTSFTESTKRGMKKIIDPIVEFASEALGASGALEEFYALFQEPPQSGGAVGGAAAAMEEFKTKAIAMRDSIRNVGLNINESVAPALDKMKAKVMEGTEGMSLLDIATRRSSKGMTDAQRAGAQLGGILGNAFSQAALHAQSLLDVVKNLAKQLASRAIVTGLQLLLTGGIGSKGFFKTMFGGVFHQGGIVQGSGERLVKVKGGEGIFTASQMKAMGGARTVNVHLTNRSELDGQIVYENQQIIKDILNR